MQIIIWDSPESFLSVLRCVIRMRYLAVACVLTLPSLQCIEKGGKRLHMLGNWNIWNAICDQGHLEPIRASQKITFLPNPHVLREWPSKSTPAPKGGKKTDRSIRLRDSIAKMLGFNEISTVRVRHRGPHCYGLVLRHKDGWSIAYSGDAMPSEELIRGAKGVDCMIHEATLEDDQAEMALAKGHSTFGQAIKVARDAGAKACLLTHFSQRYPKLAPVRPNDGGKVGNEMPIALASDLMSVSLADLWKADRYRTVISKLFSDAEDPEDGASDNEADGGAEGESSNGKRKQKGSKTKGGPASNSGKKRQPEDDATPGGSSNKKQKRDGSPKPPQEAGQSKQESSTRQEEGQSSSPKQQQSEKKQKQQQQQKQPKRPKQVKPEVTYLRFAMEKFAKAQQPPSKKIVADSIDKALSDMHGAVGGAFEVDVKKVLLASGKGNIAPEAGEAADAPAEPGAKAPAASASYEVVLSTAVENAPKLKAAVAGTLRGLYENDEWIACRVRTLRESTDPKEVGI